MYTQNLTHKYLGKVMGGNNTWLNTKPKPVFKQYAGSFAESSFYSPYTNAELILRGKGQKPLSFLNEL